MLNSQALDNRAIAHAAATVGPIANELSQANLPLIDRATRQKAQEVVEILKQHTKSSPEQIVTSLPKNVNREHDDNLTVGQRIADKIAATMGSWRFIILQSTLIATWITLNCIPGIPHFDAAPFILLNLMMSFQAAYAAPVIMMSQNRQADKDRLAADLDHEVNLRNEARLEKIIKRLDRLEKSSQQKGQKK